jgi:hypothetical protein
MLNLHKRKRAWQRTKLSVNKHKKAVKAESKQAISHSPKQDW